MKAPPPVPARTLALLLLVGLALRLLALDAQPLWWDEGYSLFFATETPQRLIELTSLDIHPPLYYLMLQGWMALVGIGAMQARLLSVLLGVATLPVAWWVARPWLGARAAWLATLLLAISPFHVYYSQEVRMYALVTLLALLSVGAWQRRAWGWLGLAAAAGLLTHYYFALLLGSLALLTLRDLAARRYAWRGPLRALAIATLLYLPWLLYSGFRLVRYVSGKLVVEADAPMSPLAFLPRHLLAWSVGHLSAGYVWLGWLALLFVALALLGIWDLGFRISDLVGKQALSRKSQISNPNLVVLWLLPTIGTFLINLVAPFNDPRIERQLLFVLPFFLMLVARGLVYLWERSSRAAVVLLAMLILGNFVALWGFYTVPRYPGEDPRPLLAQVGAEQGAGDAWLAVYPWQIGFLRAYLPDAHPTPVAADLTWVEDEAQMAADLSRLLDEHPRLWFPAYQVKGRLFEEKVARTLDQVGVQAWNEWDGNTRLYLFGRAPAVPALVPIGTFEAVGEVRAALGASTAPSGIGIVPLFFEGEQATEGVRASVQLLGRGGVWGEWDGEVTEGLVRAGLPVLPGTSPGEYTVSLTLYREADGQPLQRFQGAERLAPEATLGSVTIQRPPAPLPAEALQLAATRPASILLDDTIRFLGSSVPQEEWLQGETVPLTLFWQALAAPETELRVFVQALDESGTVQAGRDLAPVNGTFPTTQWQAGDLVRDPHRLALPADLSPGSYRLVAGFYNPESGQRLTTEGGNDVVELGTLQVEERARLMEEPTIGKGVDVLFGTRARLIQVAAPEALEEAGPLEITLLWQAMETGGAPLRAFAQLYHENSQVAVSDHPLDPPASAWLQGEWIVDPHSLDLPNELPPGEYRLVVGLYDPATGQRLPTSEGEWAMVAQWQVGP